ncbi:TPA: hypothetical protein ACQ431_002954 [Citrobacter murliniae]
METKFLSDGRKVVIVGALNNQETIVQEVFVTAQGDEIPGGERFVVKSLHDQPVETYLSREKAKQERELETAKAALVRVNGEINETKNKLSFWKDLLNQTKALSEHIDEQDFSYFIDVMTGKMNYAVADTYGTPKIEPFAEFMSVINNDWHGGKYEGIKLLSLLGNSNGNINFKVNRWPDGSGDYTTVTFFHTYEQAREFVKMKVVSNLEKRRPSISEVKSLLNMGITFSQEEMAIIRTGIQKRSESQIRQATETFNKATEAANAELTCIDQLIADI